MTIDYQAALALEPVVKVQRYDARDAMLYALGVGLGREPTDPVELRYLYEKGLRTLPMMPAAMCFASMRLFDLGANLARSLHGEQRLRIHRPLPSEGVMRGTTRIADVIDNGLGKGALVLVEREMVDDATGKALATAELTIVCRDDGGFGGPPRPRPAVHSLPVRAPDAVVEVPTSPRAALIYRLTGDYHPLHVDPEIARKAGFERPILHGLATFGAIGWAAIRTMLDGDGDAMAEFNGRFSAPVLPGEKLRIELWRDRNLISVRAASVESGETVFDNGLIRTR